MNPLIEQWRMGWRCNQEKAFPLQVLSPPFQKVVDGDGAAGASTITYSPTNWLRVAMVSSARPLRLSATNGTKSIF